MCCAKTGPTSTVPASNWTAATRPPKTGGGSRRLPGPPKKPVPPRLCFWSIIGASPCLCQPAGGQTPRYSPAQRLIRGNLRLARSGHYSRRRTVVKRRQSPRYQGLLPGIRPARHGSQHPSQPPRLRRYLFAKNQPKADFLNSFNNKFKESVGIRLVRCAPPLCAIPYELRSTKE